MTPPDAARRLCWHGALLFLLGLLTGVAVPLFTNSRMGLSAHLAGVQNGMVLLLFGLLWQRLVLSARAARAAFQLSLASLYAIWLALLLAAAFGTSATTPIAGAGHAGSTWQELVVGALLYAGSAGIIAGAGLVLMGFRHVPGRDAGA